jgi:hypothetical protein
MLILRVYLLNNLTTSNLHFHKIDSLFSKGIKLFYIIYFLISNEILYSIICKFEIPKEEVIRNSRIYLFLKLEGIQYKLLFECFFSINLIFKACIHIVSILAIKKDY